MLRTSCGWKNSDGANASCPRGYWRPDRSSEVLHLIAEATDGDSARVALRDALGLDLDQVEVVLTVQFAHLHAAARRVRSHELQELRASIDALAAVLATPDSPTS